MQTGRHLDRPPAGGLPDVLDLILDKGLVIDVYVRVSLVGIELLTVDARIVAASVDTYLRFAEAVNRLDLADGRSPGPSELVNGVHDDDGARDRSAGAPEGAQEQDGQRERQHEERPRRHTRPAAHRREQAR
ncbi:gas vesicle protein GvpJ [Kitasatospora sp. NPDC093679]|uniref:gas vesicle protein GvpJ n=1 Tax=Kitasatospora sp. NPDC093679 TaxID=3154983 RepID=UPI0034195F87